MDIPKAPLGKNGKSCIDWDTLAKQFKCKSAIAMLDKLYGSSAEELKSGKMSVTRLSKYLGVGNSSLVKLIKKHGYHIIPGAENTKNVSRGRSKIHYPYRKLRFKTESDMWKYFIENGNTPKEVINKIAEISGKYFVYKVVNVELKRARRRYKKGEL